MRKSRPWVVYNPPSKFAKESVEKLTNKYLPGLKVNFLETRNDMNSDLGRFWENGYNGIGISEYKGPAYPFQHSTQDVSRHVDFSFVAQITKLIAIQIFSWAEEIPACSNPNKHLKKGMLDLIAIKTQLLANLQSRIKK